MRDYGKSRHQQMLLLIMADRLMTPHGSRCLAMNVGTSILEVTTCVVSKSCVSR